MSDVMTDTNDRPRTAREPKKKARINYASKCARMQAERDTAVRILRKMDEAKDLSAAQFCATLAIETLQGDE